VSYVAEKLTPTQDPAIVAHADSSTSRVRERASTASAVDVRWSLTLFDVHAAVQLRIGESGLAISLRVGMRDRAPAASDPAPTH